MLCVIAVVLRLAALIVAYGGALIGSYFDGSLARKQQFWSMQQMHFGEKEVSIFLDVDMARELTCNKILNEPYYSYTKTNFSC